MKNLYPVNSSVKDLNRTHETMQKNVVLSVTPTNVY